MSKTKGSAHRLVKTPGYHIRSRYDLHGLRERKAGGSHREYDIELPLTSMIDMFSILVIFLLINFSSTGDVFFVDKDMKLPLARHAHPMGNNPLLSITRDTVIFDAQPVADNPLHLEEVDQNMPKLRAILQRIKRTEQQVRPGQPFKGEINVQADEGTPVVYVKRALATLISEGWTGIHFATAPPKDAAEPEK